MLPGFLDGVKVVELAQNAAMPHCGRLLAGMGADVVKVEPPTGDAMRQLSQLGPAEARAYAVINPGKRSICLDLAADDARTVIEALLRWADVALVAFKRQDLARFGIDFASARAVNPRIVHAAISGFGPEGPDADQGGYDVLAQARSGIGFFVNRTADGVPLPTRPAINDFGTGMVMAMGVVAALRHAERTGEAQQVEASLLGTGVNLCTPILARFEAHDEQAYAETAEDLTLLQAAGASFDDVRATYESRVNPGRGAFQLYFRHYATADGLVSVAALSPALYPRFHEVTGLPEVPELGAPDDPVFLALIRQAEDLFRTATTEQWIERFHAVGYPCTRYNTPFDVLDDPQVRANDYLVELDHPVFGRYTTTGMPVGSMTAATGVRGPSPTLGADTDEVLAEIGLAVGEIGRLRASGVVGRRH